MWPWWGHFQGSRPLSIHLRLSDLPSVLWKSNFNHLWQWKRMSNLKYVQALDISEHEIEEALMRYESLFLSTTLTPKPQNPNPKSQPKTRNPKPETLNPKPKTQNPKP
jgi:hypothetical protein